MKSAGVSFVGSSFLLFFICAVVPTTSRAQTSSTGRLEFAYAVDQNTNAVLGYKVGTTGALTPLATPSFHAGVAPNSIAIDSSGRFVYVVNLLSDNVSGYAISADGTLKPVPGSPFPAGSGPGWITIDPTGRFVYVANCADLCSGLGQGSVSGYAINKSTGTLTAVPGSPFTAEQIPYAVTVDQTGSFAYVANFRSGTISVFKIDQCSGSLWASTQSVPTGGSDPLALTLDPHGRFLYVTNTGSNNVSAFAVESNGVLKTVPGSPFASGNSTQGIVVSSSGEFLYVTAGFGVLGYSIETSGQLVPLAGSPFPASGFLVSLGQDKRGHYLYGAASAAGVDAFKLDPTTGKLTTVTGTPFATHGNAASVTTAIGR